MDQAQGDCSMLLANAIEVDKGEETDGVDSSTFDQDFDMDNFSDAQLSDAMSPNSKLVVSMSTSKGMALVESEPISIPSNFLTRPVSSGDEAAVSQQYHMKAANFRTAQVKHPKVSQAQQQAVLDTKLAIPHDQSSRPIEANAAKSNVRANSAAPINSPESLLTLGNQHRLVSCSQRTEVDVGAVSHSSGSSGHSDENQSMEVQDWKMSIKSVNDIKRDQVQFSKFSPLSMTIDKEDAMTREPLVGGRKRTDAPEVLIQEAQNLRFTDQKVISSRSADMALPSIESGNVDMDKTIVEQATEPAKHQRVATSTTNLRSRTVSPMTTTNPSRPKTVLSGRIAKHTGPNMQAQRLSPSLRQDHVSSGNAGAPIPSEEDLFFLLMHRNRRVKERELELAASYKQLQAQNSRLHEQAQANRQQLGAAHAHQKQQETDIDMYRAEIEEFKARFTKFKEYAKELANDHVELRSSMKQIRSTQSEIVAAKDYIVQDVVLLKHASTGIEQKYDGLVSKIKAVAREVGPLEHTLHVAEEKARVNDAYLHHERLRNNRTETRILQMQKQQEHLSVAARQEYRSAAAYLDELCQTVLRLGSICAKRLQPTDPPGVEKCLTLLQTMMETQGLGNATLVDTKDLVGALTTRLLAYHATAEEASKTAASYNEHLGRNVITQMTSSLDAISPSIATEVNFATLRKRIKNLQTMIKMGHQALNNAYNGKNSSEQREQEQSRRIDELLEQLAEANKRPTLSNPNASTPNLGPDVSHMFSRMMQANTRYADQQAKVMQKDEELHQQRLEILKLKDELRRLCFEQEESQSSFCYLEEKHRNLQGDTDKILRANIALEAKFREFEAISREAEKVPGLLSVVAAKNIELKELQQQAVQGSELAARITAQSDELQNLRLRAVEVTDLTQKLASYDAELQNLRVEAARVRELTEKLSISEAEILKLQPKVAQFDARASQNVVLQLELINLQNENKTLEQQIATLQLEVATSVQQKQDNVIPKARTAKTQPSVEAMRSQLANAQQLRQRSEFLDKELTTITVKCGDHNLPKKVLNSQRDIINKQPIEIVEFQNGLEKAQSLTSQTPELQSEIQQLPPKYGKLCQEREAAKLAVEGHDKLKAGSLQEYEELSALRTEPEMLKEVANQLYYAQEEGKQKDAQVSTLREQLNKLQAASQELPGPPKAHTPIEVEDEFPTQQTMLELRDMLDQEEQQDVPNDPAAMLRSSHFQPTLEMPQSQKADRTTPKLKSHAQEAESSEQGTKTHTDGHDETQQIPDSQPQVSTRHVDLQNMLATSSPLSDLKSPGRRTEELQQRKRDVPGSHPPSSSCGGDAMLLEGFEGIESLLEDSDADNAPRYVEIPHSRRQSHKHHGYGHPSSRTMVTKNGTGPVFPNQRSGKSSQVTEKIPTQEPRLSSPSRLLSSPAGLMKHLPNSAVKRLRLDHIEAISSTQASSKRLKRTPANLKIGKSLQQPSMSSSTQITEPDLGRASRVGLGNGSRKGNVVGANAPALGKAQGSQRQLRKRSKSARYTERFNHD